MGCELGMRSAEGRPGSGEHLEGGALQSYRRAIRSTLAIVVGRVFGAARASPWRLRGAYIKSLRAELRVLFAERVPSETAPRYKGSMEMLESISPPAPAGPWKCPYAHEKGKKHDKKNKLPTKAKNDATKLGDNLKEEQQTSIKVKGASYDAQLAAHHILPGNESWPKTDLFAWIDDAKGKVRGDIGYDVNGATNGVNLGDDELFPKSKLAKKDYAFGFMATRKVQFHDRHPAYSDFVINTLNKIAARLDEEANKQKGKGCGEKDCGGAKGADGKFDPPYQILSRIDATARRLKGYLIGKSDKWRMPVMTSRFSVMYKASVTEEEARAALRAAREQMSG